MSDATKDLIAGAASDATDGAMKPGEAAGGHGEANLDQPGPRRDHGVVDANGNPVDASAGAAPRTAPKSTLPPEGLFGTKKADPKPVDPKGGISDLPDDATIARYPAGIQTAMKSMRARIDEQNKKLAELEARKPEGADPEALKKLQAEYDKTVGELEKLELERSPRFQMRFEEPRKRILDQVKGYITDAGLEEEAVKAILEKAPGASLKERISILSEHAPELKEALMPMFVEMDRLNRDRASELSQSRETRKADLAQHEQMTRQFREKTFTGVLERAIEKGHDIFKKVDGNEEWNKMVDSVIGTAKELVTTDDVEVQTAAVLLGAAYPRVLEFYIAERDARLKVEAELAKYRGVMPRLGAGALPVDEGASRIPQNGRMDADQAAEAATGRLRL